MSLKSEIALNYQDADGLVCNRPCYHTDNNPSGNGVMYLGELMVLLALRKELDARDSKYFWGVMTRVMLIPGLIFRSSTNKEQEGPDDYLGFAAGVVATGETFLAEKVLEYGYRHKGSFNNEEPQKWTWKSFLWRQPQLFYALLCAAGKNRFWHLPFALYTAAIIATSCYNAPLYDQDARRLSFLLIYATSRSSLLCRLASKVWKKRLYKQYGASGLLTVYAGYFGLDHPFTKYFPSKEIQNGF